MLFAIRSAQPRVYRVVPPGDRRLAAGPHSGADSRPAQDMDAPIRRLRPEKRHAARPGDPLGKGSPAGVAASGAAGVGGAPPGQALRGDLFAVRPELRLEKQDSLECQGYLREDAGRIGINVLLYALHE